MANKRDWNYERHRTRDLLLEYDRAIMTPRPRAAGLDVIYPWENYNNSMFEKQLFNLASNSGFTGTETEFKEQFGSYLQGKEIVFDNFINFPKISNLDKLYFDLEEKILYYWDGEYIPINTLLIKNTILNGGNATEE